MTAADLVGLRDVGSPDLSAFRGPSPLGVSPDGQEVAFVISRAEPSSNDYCVGLVVVDVDGHSPPRLIDRGSERIMMPPDEIRGLITPYGLPAVVTPMWSPDGAWIAFLRRSGGHTQAWRIRPDGSGLSQVSHDDADVEAIAWTPDGLTIVTSSRPALADAAREIAREGQTGFLYDERIDPSVGAEPRIRGPVVPIFHAIDIETQRIRAATDAERSELQQPSNVGLPARAKAIARSSDGWRVWTASDGTKVFGPVRLHMADPSTRTRACTGPVCSGDVLGLWWSGDGQTAYLLRLEGWGESQFALYRWDKSGGDPQRVLTTDDVLAGCRVAGPSLICLREGSTNPRRVVVIDPTSGRARNLFDPNPEFASLILGHARRLHWTNRFGVESFGDLVLPPGKSAGRRLPLIVVQYRSRGFLRGGVGDEYPVQLFAAQGFAVLSVEEPVDLARLRAGPGWPSYVAAERFDLTDWRNRRSIADSVLSGVRLLLDDGLVDPNRIGLTGLSDGATTARYLLIHSSLFKAAAISTCCMEPTTSMIYGGEAWAEELESYGYPSWSVRAPYPTFWKATSLAMNAAFIRAPILMQQSDDEYLLSLETYEALRMSGTPVEMRVFPDEHHVKWQPAHRLAIYQRNLDWFAFWLQSRETKLTADERDYARWHAFANRGDKPQRHVANVNASYATRTEAMPRRRPVP